MGNRLKSVLGMVLCTGIALMVPGCSASENSRQCLSDFLEGNGEWFTAVDKGKSDGDRFSPVTAMAIQGGEMYVRTWGGDFKKASFELRDGYVQIHPKFVGWLGAEDELGFAAKKVRAYADGGYAYALNIAGACKSPDEIIISIEKSRFQKEVVRLSKLAQ